MRLKYLFCVKKKYSVSDECNNDKKAENCKVNKRKRNSFLSNLFLGWMFPILIKGNVGEIDENDLVEPSEKYDSETVGNVLEKYWFAEIQYCKTNNRKPSLTKALWRAFGFSFIPSGVLILLMCLCRIATPMVFAQLITYWTVGTNMTKTTAIYYSAGLVVLTIMSIMCQHHSTMDNFNFGMKLRVACSSLLYRKLLRMNQSSLGKVAAGKIINLMTNDVAKFEVAFLFLHHVWVVPIQICIVLYFLYNLAGYPPVAGFMVMIVFVCPSQALLTKLTAVIRRRYATRSDARIKLMNEIVNGIQVIKMYAWEKPFQEVVKKVRKREIIYLRKSLAIMFTFVGMIQYSDRVTLFVTMVIMYYNGVLAAATLVFPIQQYFGIFQMYLTLNIPLALGNYTELLVSVKRIEEVLLMDEIGKTASKNNDVLLRKFDTTTIATKQTNMQWHKLNSAVELQDVSASWDQSKEVLTNITQSFQIGKLTTIIGSVGSGKTSLFQVLLNELFPTSGKVIVNGQISYASQEPWIFSDTVRENILFGSPLEPEKYRQVCQVCCLNPDFEQLSNGDLTLVGERGVTLSGGQRARINLARAIYIEADIYLLDDPLSAVDTHVAKALFEGCINGYLKNKTRILITHQTHFIKDADKIIVLNEGEITNQSDYSDLVKNGSTQIPICDENVECETNYDDYKVLSESNKTIKARNKSTEIEKEFRAIGHLSYKVFLKYFSAVNSCFIAFMAFGLIIATQVFGTVCDYAISFWTNEVEKYKQKFGTQEIPVPGFDVNLNIFSTKDLFILFGCLLLVQILLTNIRIFPLVSMMSRASSNIHDKMFQSIINAEMMLFNTNPPGRILNRFSKDMGVMDDMVPRSFTIMSQIFLQVIGALVINGFSLSWTVVPSVVLIILFMIILKYSLLPTQAVKRLENTSKSPVLGKINTTFSGIATIRCNKAENKMIKEFDVTQNLHSNAYYTYIGCTVNLAMYLDFICIIYLAAIIFIFLLTDVGLSVQVGFIGIAISQTMLITYKLQAAAKFATDYMGQMTSVERALEYTKLPMEDDVKTEVSLVTDDWPRNGSLTFKDFSLSYNDTKVLKNITFDVQSGWKVGVVGRTGAGKSSLISALFRLYNIEGTISIDGIDTSLIPKQTLRSNISIIPQEPVLFSASLRYNLDPFNLYSDDAIWKALEQVELKGVVSSLDYDISEGGSNFSVGQRQLICLARAILRSNNILVMDEATANVDPQTDSLIQRTIKKLFAECTVLTIAHRLNTIMDSDRILVLDQGNLVEYDHPYVLLSNTDSLFYGMVQKTGKNMTEKHLHTTSMKYHEKEL